MDIELVISHRQLCVFDTDLENPYNDWSRQHSAQGFTYREGSVSFATLMDSGPINLSLETAGRIQIDPAAVRVIQVPFTVPGSGQIEVGSVLDGTVIVLPAGEYSLYYQAYSNTVKLTFVVGRSNFDIIRHDPELSPTFPLLTAAEPA